MRLLSGLLQTLKTLAPEAQEVPVQTVPDSDHPVRETVLLG
jgi:hypothetical protein